MTTENTQVVAPATTTAAVTVPTPVVPGSPEYNAAMIAKARGSRALENGVERTFGPIENPTEPVVAATSTEAAAAAAVTAPATAAAATVPPKPSFVPDKFYDAKTGVVNYEAMAKSQQEAEATLSRTRQELATLKATPAKTAEQLAAEATVEAARVATLTPEQKAAEAAAKVAQKTPAEIAAEALATEAAKVVPVTFAQAQEAATAELAKDGKLSDVSYAAFEKLGIPKPSVDAFIQGQHAQANVYLNEIYTAGGGKDSYTSMVQWAAANLSAEETVAFDGVLRAGDRGAMQMAVAGLKARFTASNGTSGTLVQPAPGEVQTATAAFQNQAELTAAMKDPRYAKDSAYRNQVAAKLAASKRQGISVGINAFSNRA